jgi:hypothetical protein
VFCPVNSMFIPKSVGSATCRTCKMDFPVDLKPTLVDCKIAIKLIVWALPSGTLTWSCKSVGDTAHTRKCRITIPNTICGFQLLQKKVSCKPIKNARKTGNSCN